MAVDSGTSTKQGKKAPAGKDVTSHLNKAEAATLATLDAKTRDRKTEKGYIVGPDGKIIAESTKSRRDSAAFLVSDLMKAKDAIITHNHPNADMLGTTAARVGLPLSPTDSAPSPRRTPFLSAGQRVDGLQSTPLSSVRWSRR